MKKKSMILGIGACLSLAASVGIFADYSGEKEKPVSVAETVEVKSEAELAAEKVKLLNQRVIDGEERLIDQSAVFPDINQNEAFEQADLVVEGIVSSINREYMEDVDIPFTDFNFSVSDYWKIDGDEFDVQDAKLIVTQDGNKDLSFSEHSLMNVGGEYILFLKKIINENNEEKLIMIGGPSGKFDLKNDVINQKHDSHSNNGKDVKEFILEASEREAEAPIANIEGQ